MRLAGTGRFNTGVQSWGGRCEKIANSKVGRLHHSLRKSRLLKSNCQIAFDSSGSFTTADHKTTGERKLPTIFLV